MSYEISTKLSYITIQFSGKVTAADFKEAFMGLHLIENEKSFNNNQLIDVRGVTSFCLDFDEIRELEEIRRKTIFHNNFKTAFLAFSQEEIAFVHFLKIINANPQISRNVFSSRMLAEDWLYDPS